MAYFIGMRENAGQYEIKDEKTGAVKTGDYHNFTLLYADVVDDSETTKNELDRTKYGIFEEKIKVEKLSSIFGFVPSCASAFDGAFLQEIDVRFGREGISSVKFKDTSFLNGDTKTTKKA